VRDQRDEIAFEPAQLLFLLERGVQPLLRGPQFRGRLLHAPFEVLVHPVHRLFGLVALNELADLTADRRKHFEHVRVRLADFPAEKFDHAENVFPEANGKPERAVQTIFGRQRGAWKIGVLCDVGNPLRFGGGPDASRQTGAAQKFAGASGGDERGGGHGGRVPDVHATQELPGSIDTPERADVPAQAFADRLQDLRRGFGERGRLGEHADDAEFGRAPFLGAFAGRDVANVPGEHRRTAGANARDREFHRKFLAALPHRCDLDSLAENRVASRGNGAAHSVAMPAPEMRRHDQFAHFPAERFGAGVAERLFRRRIEINDASLMIDGDDAVERGFENGGPGRLAQPQRSVGRAAGVVRGVDWSRHFKSPRAGEDRQMSRAGIAATLHQSGFNRNKKAVHPIHPRASDFSTAME
jgi:hypothetical protein